jgi:hypothetical protein
MTYIYPLHNLMTDTPKQMEALFAHIGMINMKLIGGKACEYLNSL